MTCFGKRATLGLALVLVGCSNAPMDGDPWVGSYDATRVTSVRDCATGVALPGSPNTAMSTLELMRDAEGRLFLPALCAFTFDEPEPTHAELVPLECDTELADGTPVHVTIMDGYLDIEGDHLTGAYETRTTTGTECVDGMTTIDATRR